MRSPARPPFDPEPHRAALGAILDEIAAREALDARALDRIVQAPPEGRRPRSSRRARSSPGLRAPARGALAGDAEALVASAPHLRPCARSAASPR